jgi:hypothetical protein
MTNNILDILYTPLDIPTPPEYDKQLLKEWCQLNQNQTIENRGDGKRITPEDIYPWNIVYARRHNQWLDNFNGKFPELSKYFYESFGICENNLGSIVLLPVKPHYVTKHYWHADPDDIGLRLYLENDHEHKDFLLIKPTAIPYNTRKDLGPIPESGITPKVQNVIHSARMLRSDQAFYINNVRAIHTVDVSHVNSSRLAVLIFTNNNIIPDKTKKLILESAKKFSELAIIWSNDSSTDHLYPVDNKNMSNQSDNHGQK